MRGGAGRTSRNLCDVSRQRFLESLEAQNKQSRTKENIRTEDSPIGQINSPPPFSRSLISFSSAVINFLKSPRASSLAQRVARETSGSENSKWHFRRISPGDVSRHIFTPFFLTSPRYLSRQRGYDRHHSTSTGDIFKHKLPKRRRRCLLDASWRSSSQHPTMLIRRSLRTL